MAETKTGLIYNDYKPVSRGNYGVRVARNGFDAQNAGDSNLLFNSGWRIIQIVKVISEQNKVKHIDESSRVQPSWTYINETVDGVYIWDCAVDEKWLYLPGVTKQYYNPNTSSIEYIRVQYKIYHGLGYVPLFFKSQYVSDTPGYYLMTNVDIRQDADYPYTSKASYYDGNTKNYGIKSKSYARGKMPSPGETRGCGINTSIQSKLVMAVKTEKSTAGKSVGGGQLDAPNVAWAVPLDNNSQTTTNITDYEPFGFYGGSVGNTSGAYLEYPVGQVPTNQIDGSRYQFIDQWGAAFEDTKAAMVILRSPMVAPDIEEFTIQ